MSGKTRAMHARIDDARVARSICPYCGVGCGQLIYHKDGKLISIEGDPESPISQGNLCPKGAASYQLLTHPRRELIAVKVARGEQVSCLEVGAVKAIADVASHGQRSTATQSTSFSRSPRAKLW